VGDSLYAGESILKHLPKNIDMIGTVHPKGGLYEPAPQKQSGRGARRKKGNRLPTLDLAVALQKCVEAALACEMRAFRARLVADSDFTVGAIGGRPISTRRISMGVM
jgi:hypothetical protein